MSACAVLEDAIGIFETFEVGSLNSFYLIVATFFVPTEIICITSISH